MSSKPAAKRAALLRRGKKESSAVRESVPLADSPPRWIFFIIK
jgi:hypothetical protein